MNNQQNLVSIIITSYNYGRFIRKTIESVISQTYPNWELIITDDASTDDSIEQIKKFNDPRIKLLTSNKNQGACKNYQKAYKLCKGKYITSIDSDDFIAPEKIKKQVAIMEKENIDICGTYINQVDNNNNIVEPNQNEAWFNNQINLNEPINWIWSNHLCHSSVLMKKTVHDKGCLFDEDLIYTPDYDLWIKCLANNFKFHVIPEKLTYNRYHPDNITKKDPLRYFWEYLYISLKTLHPYLLKINRQDLISKNIENFLNPRNYFSINQAKQAKLLEFLLSGSNQNADFKDILKKIKQPSTTINYNLVAGYIDYKNEETFQLQKELKKITKKLKINANKKLLASFSKTIENYIKSRNTKTQAIEQENIRLKEEIKTMIKSLKKENINLYSSLSNTKAQISALQDKINEIESSRFFKLWQKIKKII